MSFTYDTAGRIASACLSNSNQRTLSVQYDYSSLGNLGYTITTPSGVPFHRQVLRHLHFPERITACTNLFNDTPVNGYAYLYDTIGRPTNRNANAFAYDRRGQVVSATLNTTTNTYAYDYAGNRTTSNDSIWGSTTWNANELNQYASGANHLFTYDLDGNMTSISDGTILAWDAHNRLTSFTKGSTSCSYTYDYRHRRTSSTITTPTSTTRHTFFYDDWNLIYEQVDMWDTATETWIPVRTYEYFWGPDLSGTLQGAGGIGGLLAVSIDNVFYIPCTDNLGNITAYVSETGVFVATYVYDAFGNAINSSGILDTLFHHRFSSKYYDSDTELYYYGYRFYAPRYGRWIKRDPIGEDGGKNVYSFINNTAFEIDYLGMDEIEILEDKFRDMVSEAKNRKFFVAAKNLEHFLEGSGSSLEIDWVWLRGNWVVKKSEKKNRKRFENKILEDGRKMQNIDSKQLIDYWDAKATAPTFTELYYASGTFVLTSYGSLSLKKDGCELSISGEVDHFWWDTYDWHADLATYIPSFGVVSDSEALALEIVGKGKSFQMVGRWTQEVRGKIQLDKTRTSSIVWGSAKEWSGYSLADVLFEKGPEAIRPPIK